MLKISLIGDRELIARFEHISPSLHRELRTTISALVLNLRTKVMVENLSGPTGAHTLNAISGRLRRSVKESVEDHGEEGVVGKVSYGADVPYARIHELGGTIHIPEIRPVTAQALHFMWQGREMFLKKVAAHDVHMPERAPLRTAFENYLPTMQQALKEAVRRALTV